MVFNALDQPVSSPWPVDISVGMMVTRLSHENVPLTRDGLLHARSLRTASAFRIADTAGTLRFVPASLPSEEVNLRRFGSIIHLPLGDDRASARAHVRQLATASAAFPYAWAPVELSYYPSVPRGDRQPPRVTEPFVDGGLFDNHPLTLAAGLYEHRPGAGQAGDPLTIMVNPDVRRGSPASGGRVPTDVRGLAGVFALASSLIPAAREYELQMLSRELEPDSLGLTGTDRFHSLAGAHLGAFGAFAARPFREHDFYVGVYDGYRLVARALRCGPNDLVGCEAANTRDLLTRSRLAERDPVGEHLVSLLLRREEEPGSYQSQRCPESLDRDQRFRCNVLVNVHDALRFSQPKDRGLTPLDFVSFVKVFNGLLSNQERAELGHQARECYPSRESNRAYRKGEPGAGFHCFVEPHVPDLLARPAHWSLGFLHQALNPALLLEQETGAGAEKAVHAARFGVSVLRTPHHRGFRLSETVAPNFTDGIYGLGSYRPVLAYGGDALRFVILPYAVNIHGSGGVGAAWLPVWRVTSSFAISGSIAPFDSWRYVDAQGHPGRLHYSGYIGLGGRYSPSPLVSFDLRAVAGRPWDGLEDHDGGWSFGIEGGATLLRFFYVGGRAPDLLHNGDPVVRAIPQLVVGLHDVPGVLYWSWQFLRPTRRQ